MRPPQPIENKTTGDLGRAGKLLQARVPVWRTAVVLAAIDEIPDHRDQGEADKDYGGVYIVSPVVACLLPCVLLVIQERAKHVAYCRLTVHVDLGDRQNGREGQDGNGEDEPRNRDAV